MPESGDHRARFATIKEIIPPIVKDTESSGIDMRSYSVVPQVCKKLNE
jgi:hypothetical protein